MKTIFIIILLLISYITIGSNNSNYLLQQKSIKYKVYKIDSLNNYYLIYAKNENAIFKIVSKKDNSIKKCKIRINKFYKFNLHSILKAKGISIIPANQIYEVSGWRVDDNTNIDFEGDSIRDLYIGDNIKGLYFIKKRKKDIE